MLEPYDFEAMPESQIETLICGDVRVIRCARKSYSMRLSDDLRLTVRAPLHAEDAQIRAFVDANREWILKTARLILIRLQKEEHFDTPEQRSRAHNILSEKVRRYAQRMCVVPTSIRITGAKKRYGSCSGQNGICFSVYLLQCPDAFIDYVVVHELAHIRHKNHSPDFYAEIAAVLPDYRARIRLMRK